MLVAQSLDPTILPQSSRLPANLAGMGGLQFGGFDALAKGVITMIHIYRIAADAPVVGSGAARVRSHQTPANSLLRTLGVGNEISGN
jgi:hypothetical protein